jgi:uncharacterized LabA/DUF88 family protein
LKKGRGFGRIKIFMKKPVIYAFIDSQNLNLGTSKDIYKNGKLIYKGWKLDFKKFRRYLKDKFRVEKAFLFIGYIRKNEKLYRFLKQSDYQLVFKPITKDNFGKAKGNIDAEMVFYSAVIEFNNYDKGVFVSGDGDFYCLYEYLEKKNKLFKIIIPNKYSESNLLKKFQNYKFFLYRKKEELEFKPNKNGRRRT